MESEVIVESVVSGGAVEEVVNNDFKLGAKLHREMALHVEYLDFLKKLLDSGDRLPLAWPHLMSGINHFRNGASDFKTAANILFGESTSRPMLSLEHGDTFSVSEEEEEAEKKLMKVLMSKLYASRPAMRTEALRAVGDRQIFRSIFAFLKANPELLSILLSLLKG